jgi:hypothetical protein
MDLGYILISALITGFIARWLSLIFRSKYDPNLRNNAFLVIWAILFAMSFIGTSP